MRFENSQINPLGPLLNFLPTEATEITTKLLSAIALFFNSGGVVCETNEEVMTALNILHGYGIIEIKNAKIKVITHGNKESQ